MESKNIQLKEFMEQVPKVRLLGTKILVRVLQEEQEKTIGGIIIPVVEEDTKTKEGVVLNVAYRVIKSNEEVPEEKIEKGMKVAFSTFAGSTIVKKGVEYRIVSATDLHFVFEE